MAISGRTPARNNLDAICMILLRLFLKKRLAIAHCGWLEEENNFCWLIDSIPAKNAVKDVPQAGSEGTPEGPDLSASDPGLRGYAQNRLGVWKPNLNGSNTR
jgi:hypothetical protein